MLSAHHVAWAHMEGERAFGQAIRARRRASLARRALRRCADCARLIVHDERTLPRRNGGMRPRDPAGRDHGHVRGRPSTGLRQRVPPVKAGAQALAARVGRRAHGRRAAADRRRPGGREGFADPRRAPPRLGRPRPRRGDDRRRRRLGPDDPASSTSATCVGVVPGGQVPAARRAGPRARPAGTMRGRPTSRSCSGQASVSGTSISASPVKRPARMPALAASKPGASA